MFLIAVHIETRIFCSFFSFDIAPVVYEARAMPAWWDFFAYYDGQLDMKKIE